MSFSAKSVWIWPSLSSWSHIYSELTYPYLKSDSNLQLIRPSDREQGIAPGTFVSTL